jgi:integrase
MRRVLNEYGPEPTTEQLREFLGNIENDATRDNYIKTLRRYFRDYRGDPNRVKTFRFANSISPPPWCPSRSDLQRFFAEIEGEKERALFLMYASTGRRRNEILDLKMTQVNIDERTVYPTGGSCSKRTWYSFFNDECREALEEYLGTRKAPNNEKLFPLGSKNLHLLFCEAREETRLTITPKVLRFWFANEMARLGVPDRFIDAFQGRIPRSVLARHYTDYSLENLKAIYDRAGLRVLTTQADRQIERRCV